VGSVKRAQLAASSAGKAYLKSARTVTTGVRSNPTTGSTNQPPNPEGAGVLLHPLPTISSRPSTIIMLFVVFTGPPPLLLGQPGVHWGYARARGSCKAPSRRPSRAMYGGNTSSLTLHYMQERIDVNPSALSCFRPACCTAAGLALITSSLFSRASVNCRAPLASRRSCPAPRAHTSDTPPCSRCELGPRSVLISRPELALRESLDRRLSRLTTLTLLDSRPHADILVLLGGGGSLSMHCLGRSPGGVTGTSLPRALTPSGHQPEEEVRPL
jgi:hypothetical protein